MAETSFYWDGLITGDATLAPYTEHRYASLWQILFTRGNDEGIIRDYLNALVVAGVAGGVVVDSGAALVDGSFYENTAEVTVTIPTPVANPRIDRIALQKSWVNQTVRIIRLAGTEAGAPVAPVATQVNGIRWEISLATVRIETDGIIVVTMEDEFDNATTPLVAIFAYGEIETITSAGASTRFDFLDIPQTFKHLRIILQGHAEGALQPSGRGGLTMIINGDVDENYNEQDLWGTNITAAAGAGVSARDKDAIALLPNDLSIPPFSGQSVIDLANYANTDFFKTVIATVTQFNDTGTELSIMATITGLWKKIEGITRLTLVGDFVLTAGSTATLYGIQ